MLDVTATRSVVPPVADEAWHLAVLGPVELSCHGRIAEVSGPARAVLALLARSPGVEVPREDIVASLWGSEPPADAGDLLSAYVSRLRAAISSSGSTADGERILVATADGYLLNISAARVDAAVFERLLGEGRRSLRVGQPAIAVRCLRAALDMWRSHAYADVGDLSFVRAEAARLDELRLVALESSVDAALAMDAPDASEELVDRVRTLATEHWHRERVWAQLMVALFRLGRPAQALSVYDAAAARLAEELGASPGAHLVATREAISREDPALLGAERVPGHLPTMLAATEPVCVGRDEEIEWLLSGVDAVVRRRAQVRLVVGSAGMGKTRLIAEVARLCAQGGIEVSYAHAGAPADVLVAEADRVHLVLLDDLDAAAHEDVARVVSFAEEAAPHPVLVIVTCRDPVRVGELANAPKLVLNALPDAAIARIVASYAPTVSSATALAAMVNAGGVASKVHRAAGEWAFARAGRRIDRAAADAGQVRRSLAMMQDEISAGVLDLAHVRAQARLLRTASPRPPAAVRQPLARFTATDADQFAGRERLVAHLVSRMAGAGLVVVAGEAGSGTSSVVHAGLLPALAGGVLPGSAHWRRLVLRPADGAAVAELRQLAGAGAGAAVADTHATASHTLVVVDQFEEAFTSLEPAERAQLIDAVFRLSHSGEATVVVVVAAEYYGKFAVDEAMARLVSDNTVLVAPLTNAEIRQVLANFAVHNGLSYEDGLVDAIVLDMGADPNCLTSLSCALELLAGEPDDDRLTLAAYQSFDGLSGAIACWCDRALDAAVGRLGESERQLVVPTLLALTRPSSLGSPAAGPGRRWLVSELTNEVGAGAPAVVEALAEAGLVSFVDSRQIDDEVEIAHSLVTTRWPRLAQWAADAAKRQIDELLAQVRSDGERAVEDERRRRRDERTWLRRWLAGVVVILMVAVSGAAVAIGQRFAAASASRRADAIRVAAQAVVESDFRLALLLAVAALRLDGDGDGDGNAGGGASSGALRTVLNRAPDVVAMLSQDVTAVSASPSGARVALGTAGGKVRIVDAESWRVIAELPYPGGGPVNGLGYTADGERLVGWGGSRGTDDGRSPNGVALWDAGADSGSLDGVAFGQAWPEQGGLLADSDTLVLAHHRPTQPEDLVLIAWSLSARTPSTAYPFPTGPVSGVVVSPGGRFLAVGRPSGTVGTVVVDPSRGTSTLLAEVGIPGALSPDGQTLLVVDGADLEVWDVSTGRRAARVQGAADIVTVIWSADGRRFATADIHGAVVVRDAVTMRAAAALGADIAPVRVLRFSPDGRRLYGVSERGGLVVWDLARGPDRVAARVAAAADNVALVSIACALAGRDITPQEWVHHVPTVDYVSLCPQ